MSVFLIVRHGDSQGNAERLLIGQRDVPLTRRGQEEAARLTRRLGGMNIRRILSSDLRRAFDTLAPLADKLGLPVETDRRLREMDTGAWTGLTPEQVQAGWPELWERLMRGEDFPRPGEGESWSDVRKRAVPTIEEAASDRDEDELVVVSTHAGTALALLSWAAGFSPGADVYAGPFAPLHNASISALRMPGPWILAVNEVGHLEMSTPYRQRIWIRRDDSA